MPDNRFADILLKKGVISQNTLVAANEEAEKGNLLLEEVLEAEGIAAEIILEAKSEVTGIPSRALSGEKVPVDILKYIPEESARHYKFVPLEIKEGVLEIGILDPANLEARGALQFIASNLNMPFRVYLISQADLQRVLEEYRSFSGEVTKVLSELETAMEDVSPLERQLSEGARGKVEISEEAPITKMVAVMLKHATEGKASDIHIEPSREKLRVRFRVDGVLYTSLFLPIKVHESIISRVKILTNMQLDEKRKPQDGRFSARIEGRDIDFRVSTFPTYFGEKVAIRILDSEEGVKSLVDLGLEGRNLATVEEGLKKRYGMVLITGPTGSGKSTTLYSMLQILNQERYNIVSLEDPIEYHIEGVNQSQVRPEIGYDFVSGLRSILRQDPDTIMVGEIRDKETAQLAIHAALTGHLVLSTLHTNSAIGVVPRLIDMGVDPYLIPPTLNLILGQRLVRTLCPDSRRELDVSGSVKDRLEKEIEGMAEEMRKKIKFPATIYQALPSSTCPKGTRGRIAVFEVLSMTDELEEIVLRTPTELDVLREARRQEMITMREDGIMKVISGRVGLEELFEVV